MKDKIVIVDMATLDPITENEVADNRFGGWMYAAGNLLFEQMASKPLESMNKTVLQAVDTFVFSSLSWDPEYKQRAFQGKIRPDSILKGMGVNAMVEVTKFLRKEVDMFSLNYMCATGLKAIELGRLLIEAQDQVVLVGCIDDPIVEIEIKAAMATRAISVDDTYYGPFDKKRSGFAAGRSASYVAICSEKKAKELGVDPIAVIEDVRSATKGIARTQPSDADFLCQLVDSVVKDWDSIGHWNAHATATPVGDVIEYDMFKRSVGNRDIPISSLKGRIGHTMSNSGLCEMIHGIMSFQQKKVFKTHNLVDPFVDDPRIIMEDVSTTKDTFLKCSFGFSGKNSVVLVKCL